MNGAFAIERFATLLPEGSVVLDVGSGNGAQAALLEKKGLKVTTLDCHGDAEITAFWPCDLNRKFDAIWCCHTLEHSRNPGQFLEACKAHLKFGGLLCVVVPPAKHNIVGGHVTLWNAGLLLYNLILAGFDCRQARVKSSGYDIAVIVRNTDAVMPSTLKHDAGDIELLARYFPLQAKQNFNGQIAECNWQNQNQ